MDLQSQHFSKGLIDVVTRALYVSIYSGEIITKYLYYGCCFVLKIYWLFGIVNNLSRGGNRIPDHCSGMLHTGMGMDILSL